MGFLFMLVSSLVANCLVTAEKCELGISKVDNFNVYKFAGQWYSLDVQYGLETYFSNFKNYIALPEDENGNFNVTTEVRFLRNGKQSYRALMANVTREGQFIYINNDLDYFNGRYEILDTDYDCYAVIHGCPKAAPVEEMIWIQYRSKEPTPECEEDAERAKQKFGIVPYIVRDEYNDS